MNSSLPDLQQVIQALDLQPLPIEGGRFRQVYRSSETVPAGALGPNRPPVDKPCGTAILYLLSNEPDSFSAFHRLPTDEIFHFYLGDPLEITLLHPDSSIQRVILGPDILIGQHVQFVVPGRTWQGSCVLTGGRYALIGSTMAPGYTPEDYEDGIREDLLAQYPDAADRILALTRQ